MYRARSAVPLRFLLQHPGSGTRDPMCHSARYAAVDRMVGNPSIEDFKQNAATWWMYYRPQSPVLCLQLPRHSDVATDTSPLPHLYEEYIRMPQQAGIYFRPSTYIPRV